MTVRGRRRTATVGWRPGGGIRTLALLVFQLVLFVALEGSERLAIEALAGEHTTASPFEVGFVAELLVAVAVAGVLSFAGDAAHRSLGGREVPPALADAPLAWRLAAGPIRATSVLVGAGANRAPPP